MLHQAFEVIKINVGGNEMVTYKTWCRLIKLARPGKTKHQIDLLMMVLDTDRSGYISRQQFLNIADLLNVPISVVSERKTFAEIHCKSLYMSRVSKFIRRIVDTVYFSLSYDGIVVINVALICSNIDDADWVFVCLYVIEIVLKWYSYGTKRYFHNFQHWTDVIITIISILVVVVTRFDVTGMNSDALSVLNVFRIFRILRCLVEFDRFRIIFDAVFNVSFSILTYCGILFIVFYSFAVLGMEIFAGKIQFLGYDTQNETEFSCNNSALIGRFVIVTSDAARIYFMSFHLCVAVVVMNIVTAFILDMFMYEYTFSKKGNIDTKVEMTIKNLQLGIDDETGMDIAKDEKKTDEEGSMFHTKSMFRRLTMKQRGALKPNLSRYDGIRFHIKKRGWTKTELLLQQLFELEEDDPNDAEHDYQKIRSLSLT
ncbi:Two pore calcium channel protein [Mactra antiquata]